MQGQTTLKTNDKELRPLKKAKTANMAVDKPVVFRVVLIPETSAVDKGSRNFPSEDK